MMPLAVYILLSIEFSLFVFLVYVLSLRYYQHRQWIKMWSKFVRRVPFTLFDIQSNPEVILYEIPIKSRFELLSRTKETNENSET